MTSQAIPEFDLPTAGELASSVIPQDKLAQVNQILFEAAQAHNALQILIGIKRALELE